MKQSFVPVFQTNYFSNGYLAILSLCVLAGLIVILFVWFKRDSNGKMRSAKPKMIFLFLWVPIWLIVFVLPVGTLIAEGHKYTTALAEGRSNIVEGPVLLIRQQPKSGSRSWLQSPRNVSLNYSGNTIAQRNAMSPATNAPGDLVKIGDRLFVLNFYAMGLGYQKTVVQGGVLTNGAYVRLHYLDNTIVRVEVRE
jgi:hypothetical protein